MGDFDERREAVAARLEQLLGSSINAPTVGDQVLAEGWEKNPYKLEAVRRKYGGAPVDHSQYAKKTLIVQVPTWLKVAVRTKAAANELSMSAVTRRLLSAWVRGEIDLSADEELGPV